MFALKFCSIEPGINSRNPRKIGNFAEVFSPSSVFWKSKLCCHQEINVTAIIFLFPAWCLVFQFDYHSTSPVSWKTKYDSLIVPKHWDKSADKFLRTKIQIVDCMNPACSSANEALDINQCRMTYFGVCEYLVWFYSVSQLI